MTWLGDKNPFNENFPGCDLNEKQVRTLVGFSHIRVSGLGPGQAIRKLTDSGIVEVSVRWSKGVDDIKVGGTLWLASEGEYIAAAVWEGEHHSDDGPIKVYRWQPNVRRWAFDAKAQEVPYSKSVTAIKQTRDFIRNVWYQPDITAVITNQVT